LPYGIGVVGAAGRHNNADMHWGLRQASIVGYKHAMYRFGVKCRGDRRFQILISVVGQKSGRCDLSWVGGRRLFLVIDGDSQSLQQHYVQGQDEKEINV
jgi:hypothetical protein